MTKNTRAIHRHFRGLAFERLEHRQLLATNLVITEFMANNGGILPDGDGNASDWIEVYNAGDESISLAGYRLTDKPDNLSRWSFPDVALGVGEYVVVFASSRGDDNYIDSGGNIHTSFSLKASGEYLALISPAGTILSEFGTRETNYPEQRENMSYGRAQEKGLLAPRIGYMITPTPGRSNPGVGAVFVGFVADTMVNVERGFYDQPFDIAVTTVSTDASIRYTTDGTAPTATNGAIYSGPIHVQTTTILRTAAFQEQYIPSNIATHTYLFAEDVIRQQFQPPGFPAIWEGALSSSPLDRRSADYEMDSEIVVGHEDEIVGGLRSIRTISVVMDTNDVFGPNGVYTNPRQRGVVWERPASVEIVETDGRTTFQVNAGVRIHGGATRDPTQFKKHSFRLAFRGEYGAKKLNYPLFPGSPVERFDNIVLRSGGRDSWNRSENATYMRDAFAYETAKAMGKFDSHATFLHLYLNGLYWGLYLAVERPDARMAAEYFGGTESDYDALDQDAVSTPGRAVDGDLERYRELLALTDSELTDDKMYAEIQRFLDLENLIDFVLIQEYMTNHGGPFSFNLRMVGNRAGETKFRFFLWDMDASFLGGFNQSFDVAPNIWTALVENADFRLRFADRAHKHLFDGGALTSEPSIARWQALANEIFSALAAESARWGDVKRASPFTRDIEWHAESTSLLTEYFPSRTSLLIEKLRKTGLYPIIDAPQLSQYGGEESRELGIELANPNGEGNIYYTSDATDPRLPGGSVNPSAVVYEGERVSVRDGMQINSRVFHAGQWSALNEATFVVRQEEPFAREPGDANGDGEFDQRDIVQVLQAARYLTAESATFEQGDWNGDGVFDQGDIVASLQTGNYRAGAYAANALLDSVFAEIGNIRRRRFAVTGSPLGHAPDVPGHRDTADRLQPELHAVDGNVRDDLCASCTAPV